MDYAVLSRYRPELMGFAMLWVMLFHAFDLFFGVPVLDFLRSAGFGGVDIFILVSAMGLAMSLDRKDQPYGEFMTRRAARILPGYYLVMIPYTLWCVTRGTAFLSTLVWNSGLVSYWINCKGKFNWYVTGIMLFYALTPWCFRRLKNARHREMLVGGGVALGLLVCQILMRDGYWNHLDIMYRFPIFFVGLLLGLYIRQGRKVGWKDGLFWGVSLTLGGLYLLARGRVPENVIQLPLCHLFVFTTVPMCLLGGLLFERLPLGWLRKGLRLVGENSLEIYLLNVSFFAETAFWRQFMPSLNTYTYYFVSILLNIVLGVALHQVLERLTQRKA